MKTNTVVSVVLVGSLCMFGCAKTPATGLSTAPAPTGSGTASGSKDTAGARLAQATEGADKKAAATSPAGTSRPAPSEFGPVADLRDIHFDFDKYTIRPEDGQILARDAQWLKKNPNDLLLIEGHCDERGTSEYNLALGERRAKAAMTYLMDQGVAAKRITTISYGKERPQCTGHDEACWAKNRRAHFLVKRG
jgi:peptidoglycan-associated lipoprotein